MIGSESGPGWKGTDPFLTGQSTVGTGMNGLDLLNIMDEGEAGGGGGGPSKLSGRN